MAKMFANMLKIYIVENQMLGEFPRIKCNIGKDEKGKESKIYHLPMNQQYDKVKLLRDGAFLASAVDEAEKAGFRRAYVWKG